ncbi:hypothetical protein IFM89_008274 [Coptis chinensis]|uniref:Uncharacterized protein n=1 Tax=Coptis chinensis TaxID=261450 RepID=A0A835LDW4_9MAGN|nr:hypothetical protein IFM89_008274 [Coptis chinensis]
MGNSVTYWGRLQVEFIDPREPVTDGFSNNELKQILYEAAYIALPFAMNPFWWLLALSILSFGEFSNVVSRPAVVNIGAIFTLGTINGQVSKNRYGSCY